MRFSSHEAVQERRTTLNLTPTDNLCFRDDADISFDLMLEPNMEVYFGYVFRIITADHQNIDLVFNEKLHNFNLIIGESIRGSFTIDSPHLYTGWTPVGIHFDRKDQTVSWSVNHVQKGVTRFPWKGDLCYRMCFGVSSLEEFQTADIPPMNLKDLRIAEKGETRFYWPLAESAGGEAFDSVSRRVAQIANPNWIKPLHQNWQSATTLEISGTPSVAFDAATEKLYIVGADSLYTYDVQKGQVTGWPLQAPAANLPPGNQSIVDPRSGFIYDVDIDEKSVRTYNPSTRRWTGEFPVGPLTEFWQANKFLSYGDTALYIVGGYGQLHYKNLVQRYSLVTHKWEVLHPGGDAFTPRYLAALGVSGDTAFIIGGYGSNTGDQMVNPRYDYDLVAYSVKDQRFKVLYHLSEPSTPFCFANSLVIDSARRNYYGLIFQNDKFNSALQLIKGSLSAPVYSRMGDSIPYSFYDVKSFADLFYAPHSQRLLALTLYTNKENVTEVKVYTIAFPPNAIVTVAPAPVRHFPWKYALWAAAALVVAAVVWRSARRRQRRETAATSKPAHIPALAPAPVAPAPAPTPVAPDPRSQVYFFGQFEVYDPETHELTKLFTPLLKELFLLIAIHTLKSGKGISSEKLYATLWRDKSAKDAQNNRSVNMVKLKAILDKLGTCGIGKEADKWVLHYAQDQIRMDLADFLTLVHVSTPSHDDIRQLLTIIHRGAFLSDTAYPWLDDIQSEISDKALDVLSSASLRFEGEPEFLLEIAGGIFLFDPVNEEALRVKCRSLSILGRHSLAKVAFEKFAKEYHQMYGEEFQQSFHEILTN